MAGSVPKFTAKMQTAVVHYANDPERNKEAAYRSAYDCSNMAQQSVRVKASELFNHPLMAQAVLHMKATAAEKVGIDAAWVLKRAALLADFNIRRFLRPVDGKLYYDFTHATDDDWYCISEITMEDVDVTVVNPDGGMALVPASRIKIKAERKQAALKMVGDHVNVQAFKENVEHTGVVGFAHLNAEEFKQARRDMLADDDC